MSQKRLSIADAENDDLVEPTVTPLIEESTVKEAVAEDAETELSDTSSGFNLDGTELQVQVLSPDAVNLSEVAPTVVLDSNEVEFSSDGMEVDIAGGVAGDSSRSFGVDKNRDITSDSIDFGEYALSDLSNNLPAIENVTINEAATNLGLDASDVSFTEDTIQIDLEGVAFYPRVIALIDIDLTKV